MSKFGPFELSRLKFGELYNDAVKFINNTYKSVGQQFTMASPLGQLLQVTLHFGRMILYYIEDAATELNILTATRPESIKGLATLTGHNPSRAIASKGVIRLKLKKDISDTRQMVVIPNNTVLLNLTNNLMYTIDNSGTEIRLDSNGDSNGVLVNVIQGTIEAQQATGTGEPLQSFNIQPKKNSNIDNYYVNVYVNGEMWQKQESILDMPFMSKSVMVKTGQTGGIDVFFGNGYNGLIPNSGAVITIEYLMCDGLYGNVRKQSNADDNAWSFKSNGYTINSENVDLNSVVTVSLERDIILGASSEPIYLTRLLAPNTSRSYVLANEQSYNHFLRKLNMFSIIDAFPGYATYEDKYTAENYNKANLAYIESHKNYMKMLSLHGETHSLTVSAKSEMDELYNMAMYWSNKHEEGKKDDNTVYLYLVPDILKRISTNESYFTCDISKFNLTDDEKTAILDLIESSGQRVLTVDNVIIQPKFAKFSINMSLILWEGFDVDSIKNTIYNKLGEYFATNTRRDRLPISDINRIIEDIDGVDSVNVYYDADVNNEKIYGDGYGIDQFGDIILTRNETDYNGNQLKISDIYPLIRGDFYNYNDVFYADVLDNNKTSIINISVRGYTKKDYNALNSRRVVDTI
ncbi:MAG: hypothetical protein ACRDD8_14260 [Bacteroidales bacterium]